jgi:hypothetical protein
MATERSDSTDDLRARIRGKREQVSAYLARVVPRRRRLLNVTILGGTLSALLTVAPAMGGKSFTDWLTHIAGLRSPAWQLLCGAAAVSSAMATIATQLLKSHNIEEHLTRAQSCRAKLEVLEIGLGLGQVDVRQATSEYIRCVEDTAFIDSQNPSAA